MRIEKPERSLRLSDFGKKKKNKRQVCELKKFLGVILKKNELFYSMTDYISILRMAECILGLQPSSWCPKVTPSQTCCLDPAQIDSLNSSV